ncbi:MAG: biotin--[acetyl-CoA-carboxylase] ligase [Thermosphaera sp.]
MPRREDELTLLLELVKLLSDNEKLSYITVEKELGLSKDECERLVSILKKYYMLREERDAVVFYRGDNLRAVNPWGWNYIYRVVVGSTMNMAKKHPPWSIIVAEYQVLGKGRHGKTWIGGLGGLWITYKLRTQVSSAQLLPIAIPVLITRLLRDQLKIDALIKWPNDIIISEKKVAGILLEGEASGTDIIAYIGLGINVNNDPPIETATSLRDVIGSIVPRNRVFSKLTGWISRIDKLVDKPELLRLEYLEKLSTLGRRVRVVLREGEVVGVAQSVSDMGELIVETGSGSLKISSSEALKLVHLN